MIPERTEIAEQLNVSRETSERLEAYYNLLTHWNKRINLVSHRTLSEAWARHFLDSAQILHLAPAESTNWMDLGSGGGFPGAVVAIIAQELRPLLKVTLVESDHRKSVFLRTVAREVAPSMSVVPKRIEDAKPGAADVVSARALAPLPKLLGYARRHLTPNGTALFQKGRTHAAEIAESLETWSFDCEKHPSETDADAVVLKIGGITRAG